MNLTDELEHSFGDGPAPRPVADHVTAGRSALRRRRSLTGAAGAAGAAVALTVVLSVTGATSPDTSPDVASDPTPPATSAATSAATSTATAAAAPAAAPAEAPWPRDALPVRFHDGELEVRPGTIVHERIENPYDYRPPRTSTALDVTFDGQRTWIIADKTPRGEGFAGSEPSNGWASFADWVADQVGLTTGGTGGWPDTLRLTDQGEVVASPGSEVLQRTDDPRLGDTFAAPGEPTGAALVLAAEDVQSYFVVWRVVGGQLDVITTPPSDVPGASFEELLTYARDQYAGGEGLR